MILNALGFVSRPLYLTPEFFSNKPVDLLIRPHLCAADWTDDCLGRALDTLYENGVTELFAIVASKALSTYEIDHRFVHLDSTTFSFQGTMMLKQTMNMLFTLPTGIAVISVRTSNKRLFTYSVLIGLSSLYGSKHL